MMAVAEMWGHEIGAVCFPGQSSKTMIHSDDGRHKPLKQPVLLTHRLTGTIITLGLSITTAKPTF